MARRQPNWSQRRRDGGATQPQRELSAPAAASSIPWQRHMSPVGLRRPPPAPLMMLSHPYDYIFPQPPPTQRGDICCRCGCHSSGLAGSRQSSTTTTTTTGTTSSHSSSSWQPIDNPVALSRDAYLKVRTGVVHADRWCRRCSQSLLLYSFYLRRRKGYSPETYRHPPMGSGLN